MRCWPMAVSPRQVHGGLGTSCSTGTPMVSRDDYPWAWRTSARRLSTIRTMVRIMTRTPHGVAHAPLDNSRGEGGTPQPLPSPGQADDRSVRRGVHAVHAIRHRAPEQAAEPQLAVHLLDARDVGVPSRHLAQVVPHRRLSIHPEDPGHGRRRHAREGGGRPEEHRPEPRAARQPIQGVDAGRRQRDPEEALSIVGQIIRITGQAVQEDLDGRRPVVL